MLKIRLKRVGRNKDPYYRIVVMESAQPRNGKTNDEIGIYNPRINQFEVDKEKAEAWLKKGAQPTDTIAQYFVKAGIMKKLHRGSTKPNTQKKEKKSEE